MTCTPLFVVLRQWWPLLLGNVLEWYEFGVYGYLEPQLEVVFFRGSSDGAWLGFAVSFLMRPLGGVAFGFMADRIGRRPAVLWSLAGMTVATVGQGLLPSYRCCGEIAGSFGLVMLLILRACQGLSAGGEIASIITYFSETAPEGYVLVATTASLVSGAIAFILSSGTVAFLVAVLGPEAMLDWGWRIPFLIVIVPGLISFWGRHGLPESEIFLEEQRMRSERREHQEAAELDTFTQQSTAGPTRKFQGYCRECLCPVIIGFVASVACAVASYSGVWAPSYLQKQGMPQIDALLVGLPVFYGLSSAVALGNGSLSLSTAAFLFVSLGWGIVVGVVGSTLCVFVAELFPTSWRSRGFGLSYNLGLGYFGGTAGLMDNMLSEAFPAYGPGLYWSLAGLVSMIVLLVTRATGGPKRYPIRRSRAPLESATKDTAGVGSVFDESADSSEDRVERTEPENIEEGLPALRRVYRILGGMWATDAITGGSCYCFCTGGLAQMMPRQKEGCLSRPVALLQVEAFPSAVREDLCDEAPYFVVWLHGADMGDQSPDDLRVMQQRLGRRTVFLVPLNPKSTADGLRFSWGVSCTKAQNKNSLGFVFGEFNQEYLQILTSLISVESYRYRADRVMVWGYSMGGFGAYQLGCHAPEVFDAVVSIAGYGLGTKEPSQSGYGAPQPESSRIFEEFLRLHVTRLAHVPVVLAIHAKNDTVSSYKDAADIIDVVAEQDLGGLVRLESVPDSFADSDPGKRKKKRLKLRGRAAWPWLLQLRLAAG
ncbi:unnamed protein product [Polarella glacialis]|uniref:Major facilitator superfamily (MFS) profile domain-containing protein n=1 Tax=Polarella glacialis TaxID=89957 RepID=A0A813LQS0_POLGL|nr:unnamed protein product [Polarella glacialis]